MIEPYAGHGPKRALDSNVESLSIGSLVEICGPLEDVCVTVIYLGKTKGLHVFLPMSEETQSSLQANLGRPWYQLGSPNVLRVLSEGKDKMIEA